MDDLKTAGSGDAGLDRTTLLLFIIAVVLYVPGILWGLPEAVSAARMMPWGSDELAPAGPFAQVLNVVFRGGSTFDPRYPLLPYLIQSAFMAPYVVFLWLTGSLHGVTTVWPYGLANPVRDLAGMTLFARLSSLFATAALPAVAYLTVRRLADRRTATVAGVFTLLLYPLFYYSRTSNVDATALLFVALGLYTFAGVLRDGLTGRHAAVLGVFAALAVASKDQNYAVFVAVGIGAVFVHLTGAHRDRGTRVWRTPLIGLASAAAVYVIASGLLLNPDAFFRHVNFIVFHPSSTESGVGSGQTYFSTPATLAGYTRLAFGYAGHIVDSAGLPMAIAGLAGVAVAAKRRPRMLLLLLPVIAVFIGVLMPVRFIRIRFVLPAAYVTALFAAFAIAELAGRKSGDGSERWSASRRRKVAGVCVAIIAGWSALRAADLTWQMLNDSRLVLEDWLRANARPGDRVGYYGAALKLPHLPPDVAIEQGPHAVAYERPDPESRPEFIVIIPQQPFESEHEWNLPDERYRDLLRGEWEYDPFIAYRSPSLFRKRPINWVNPPVRLFVRRDIVPRLDQPVRRLDLD